ncbi:hypothetical protein RYX36_000690 [Vicia faba]
MIKEELLVLNPLVLREMTMMDELEAELEELESAELEEQLLQPATIALAATSYLSAGCQPTRPVPAKLNPEEDEWEALQAKMAL